MTKVLITGVLGFIGFHVAKKMINIGYLVIGIDNINSYYDIKLKTDKLPLLGIHEDNMEVNKLYSSRQYDNFKFGKIDICDRIQVENLFRTEGFDIVINLAAQAGVQYSIENPHTYVTNNIEGFVNIIEFSRLTMIKHLIYASSSSVYGNRNTIPFEENESTSAPISIYAATKKANELIAHSFSALYNLKTTGLRFFTVYGPWGRPDMAPFIFTKNIIEGNEIVVFNEGNLERDFTFIDDIVDGIENIVKNGNRIDYMYNIYNIGNSKPVNLLEFIKVIENKLNKKASIKYEPLRKGDVYKTYASVSKLINDYSYSPSTNIEKGIDSFVDWYVDYFDVKDCK